MYQRNYVNKLLVLFFLVSNISCAMANLGQLLAPNGIENTTRLVVRTATDELGNSIKDGVGDFSRELGTDLSEHIIHGLSLGAGPAFKKGFGDGTAFQSDLQDIAAASGQTATSFFDGFGKSAGPRLKQNFGHGTAFQKDLREVAAASGETAASFIESFDKKLFPFVAKYGAITIATVCLAVAGYFGTKALIAAFVNPPPRIVIQSSNDVSWSTRFQNWLYGEKKQEKMIFAPALHKRLDGVIEATKNISAKIAAGKTNCTFRNTLLYGPPGTGKTMFGLQLAQASGLEFVLVTGSSFFQPGAGIAAIDELFAWAKNSKKGLCIFIDEADSLFLRREKMDPTSDNYRIVNHFLNYLGQRSTQFMILLSTNYPALFDEAMQRRIDDAIEMPLPGPDERFATLCHYRDMILKDEKQNGAPFVEAVDLCLPDEKIRDIVSKTDAFSYGDLEGIINMLKSEADITKEGIISTELVDMVVQYALQKKNAFKA